MKQMVKKTAKAGLLCLISTAALFVAACEKEGGSGGKNPPPAGEVDTSSTKVETYKYAATVMPSVAYAVTVNGHTQYVLTTTEPHICIFGCDGPVKVVVTPLREYITSASVLPKSKKYDAKVVNAATVEFIMNPLDKAVVEINGTSGIPLFIFANPIENDKPDPSDPSVRYFKAGTETDVNTLTLTSGQTLYLEGGAIIKGYIRASGVSDISIRGCGIFDSRGLSERALYCYGVQNLTLENITVINDTNWTTEISVTDHILSKNFKSVAVESDGNDAGNQNDAFDLMGCTDAKVYDGFSYCHDDTFCVKSQKWNRSAPSKDILFENCIAWNYDCGNSFEIGYETNQDVSNVTFRNCTAIRSSGKQTSLRRAALGLHNAAGGRISDILYENIEIEDPREYGIFLAILKSSYDIGTGVEWSPGYIDGVTYRNVHFHTEPRFNCYIKGYDSGDHKIKNVTIENMTIVNERVTKNNLSKFFPTLSNADVTVK